MGNQHVNNGEFLYYYKSMVIFENDSDDRHNSNYCIDNDYINKVVLGYHNNGIDCSNIGVNDFDKIYYFADQNRIIYRFVDHHYHHNNNPNNDHSNNYNGYTYKNNVNNKYTEDDQSIIN